MFNNKIEKELRAFVMNALLKDKDINVRLSKFAKALVDAHGDLFVPGFNIQEIGEGVRECVGLRGLSTRIVGKGNLRKWSVTFTWNGELFKNEPISVVISSDDDLNFDFVEMLIDAKKSTRDVLMASSLMNAIACIIDDIINDDDAEEEEEASKEEIDEKVDLLIDMLKKIGLDNLAKIRGEAPNGLEHLEDDDEIVTEIPMLLQVVADKHGLKSINLLRDECDCDDCCADDEEDDVLEIEPGDECATCTDETCEFAGRTTKGPDKDMTI